MFHRIVNLNYKFLFVLFGLLFLSFATLTTYFNYAYVDVMENHPDFTLPSILSQDNISILYVVTIIFSKIAMLCILMGLLKVYIRFTIKESIKSICIDVIE